MVKRLGPLVRVTAARPRDGFAVEITFEDGTRKLVDLEPYLHGPVFDALRSDAEAFRALRVEGGTVTWPNGADIDADVLYYDLAPAWMEQETPAR